MRPEGAVRVRARGGCNPEAHREIVRWIDGLVPGRGRVLGDNGLAAWTRSPGHSRRGWLSWSIVLVLCERSILESGRGSWSRRHGPVEPRKPGAIRAICDGNGASALTVKVWIGVAARHPGSSGSSSAVIRHDQVASQCELERIRLQFPRDRRHAVQDSVPGFHPRHTGSSPDYPFPQAAAGGGPFFHLEVLRMDADTFSSDLGDLNPVPLLLAQTVTANMPNYGQRLPD